MKKIAALWLVAVWIMFLVGCGVPNDSVSASGSQSPAPTESILGDANNQGNTLNGAPGQGESAPMMGGSTGGQAKQADAQPPAQPAAEPAADPASDITVQYGASWFLLVNDTIEGGIKIQGGNIPVSFRLIMLMTNMDPASLEGEGEYSGQSYNNLVSYKGATFEYDITISGSADSRGYAGCRLTLTQAGEALEGRAFVEYNDIYDVNLIVRGGDETATVDYTEGGAYPITYVFKTLPAPVGSVGRNVDIELPAEFAALGLTKLKGKLYSNAEMDQQTYDEMMKQLEDFIDQEVNDAEKARQAEEAKEKQTEQQRQEAIQQLEQDIASLKEVLKMNEVLIKKYESKGVLDASETRTYERIKMLYARDSETLSSKEAQLAALQGQK